jgi:hypothetical protein
MKLLPLLLVLLVGTACPSLAAKPRVFVFTDINIDAGDPDDRQSLVHLCWYADELEIVGIVPDRWDARGLEACHLVIDAYAKDYAAQGLKAKGYPAPNHLRQLVAPDREQAVARFAAAATASPDPLWVLVWGNMELFGHALRQHPELAPRLRVVTIGTGLMLERDLQYVPANWEKAPPCRQINWNGPGRNRIYDDPRFRSLWWLELNWTYNGMFTGDEPTAMFDRLSVYGALGRHLQEVTINEPWARYFASVTPPRSFTSSTRARPRTIPRRAAGPENSTSVPERTAELLHRPCRHDRMGLRGSLPHVVPAPRSPRPQQRDAGEGTAGDVPGFAGQAEPRLPGSPEGGGPPRSSGAGRPWLRATNAKPVPRAERIEPFSHPSLPHTWSSHAPPAQAITCFNSVMSSSSISSV